MHPDPQPGQPREPQPPAGRTPNTDMQPEDAGTPDSGKEAGRGTAAESAMKQEQKTGAEAGGRG